MRLLAIDIGAGTQDILLLDTSAPVENAVQLIMPSPTIITARKIRAATAQKKSILFTGVNMGGGANSWALRQHLKVGLNAYATPEAAATFDDDPAVVAGWGVVLVSPDEAQKTKRVQAIELKDIDLPAIESALSAFGVETGFEGVAVAVLDHGAAPPGVSDRLFRFQHLRQMVERDARLLAFPYLAAEVPDYLTRMRAASRSLGQDVPLVLLDTGVAAALGSLEDGPVARHRHRLLVNLGNSHTLAFHMDGDSILGLVEHHTSLLTRPALEALLEKLRLGTLGPDEVFDAGGHGGFALAGKMRLPFLSITGPRRRLMRNSRLEPYFAAPYGDMMLTGCFGLVRAFACKLPAWREEIGKALRR